MASKQVQEEGPAIDFGLSKEDKEVLNVFFQKAPKTEIKFFLELLSMQVRAFRGQAVDPEDVYTRLTNVKEILERSRFPTYPLISMQVYLRLLAYKYPQAKICTKWADFLAKALISYKGLSRAEYTEQMKHAGGAGPSGAFFFGDQRPQQPVKRRFWQRGPKQEESEFIHG